MLNIGDIVRVKTNLGYTHSGQIGLITGKTGSIYYRVSFEVGEFLYAVEALEVLC